MSGLARADNRRVRGFSLLEVLISSFILCAAVAALLPSYLATNEVIDHGRSYELATQIAAAQLETYRGGGYDALPIATTAQQATQPITYFGSLPNAKGSVTFTRVDSNLNPTSTDTGRVKVVSTVTWGVRKSDAGTVVLTTLITSEE